MIQSFMECLKLKRVETQDGNLSEEPELYP